MSLLKILMIATFLSLSDTLSTNGPIVSLFLGPNLPDIPYFGSILNSLSTLTTYQVQCLPGNTITITTTSAPMTPRTITSTSSPIIITITTTSAPQSTRTVTSTRFPRNTITITSTRSTGSSSTVTGVSLVPEILTSLIPEVLTSLVPGVVTSLVPNVITSIAGVATSNVPEVVTGIVPGVITSLVPEVVTNLVPAGVGGILGGLKPRDAQFPSIAVSIPGVVSVGVGTSGVGLCLFGSCESSTLQSLSLLQSSVVTTPGALSCPFTDAAPQITQSGGSVFIGSFPSRTFTCTVTSITFGAWCAETGTLPCGSFYTSTYTLPAASNLLKPVTITGGFSSTTMYEPGPPMMYGAASPVIQPTSFPTLAPPITPPTAISTSICTTSTQMFLPVPPTVINPPPWTLITSSSDNSSPIMFMTMCSTSTLLTMISPPTITSTSTITKTSTSTNTGATTTVVGPQVTIGGPPFSEAVLNRKMSKFILVGLLAASFGFAVSLL